MRFASCEFQASQSDRIDSREKTNFPFQGWRLFSRSISILLRYPNYSMVAVALFVVVAVVWMMQNWCGLKLREKLDRKPLRNTNSLSCWSQLAHKKIIIIKSRAAQIEPGQARTRSLDLIKPAERVESLPKQIRRHTIWQLESSTGVRMKSEPN